MTRSKIDLDQFRANAKRGPKFLMDRFGVSRAAVTKFAQAHGVEVARQVDVRNQIDKVKTGTDEPTRQDDELILCAIQLRRKGKTVGQLHRFLGVDQDKALLIFNATIKVRAEDMATSGEKPAKVMGAYW